MKLKNGYRWRYDQNKQNFCFRKVAHLEFTFYSDFWLSHHCECTTFKKKTFFLSKVWLWNQQQHPFCPFQNKIDKGSHNWIKLKNILKLTTRMTGPKNWKTQEHVLYAILHPLVQNSTQVVMCSDSICIDSLKVITILISAMK